ncbi:hypothetical protein KIPB_011558, partial [Kipferlia bialata]
PDSAQGTSPISRPARPVAEQVEITPWQTMARPRSQSRTRPLAAPANRPKRPKSRAKPRTPQVQTRAERQAQQERERQGTSVNAYMQQRRDRLGGRVIERQERFVERVGRQPLHASGAGGFPLASCLSADLVSASQSMRSEMGAIRRARR